MISFKIESNIYSIDTYISYGAFRERESTYFFNLEITSNYQYKICKLFIVLINRIDELLRSTDLNTEIFEPHA